MPALKGSSLDPERTRAAIRDAATDLLYERGLDGIGVTELCAAAGVSKETLYRHFGSKSGLVRAVLEERSDRITRWLVDAVGAAGDDPVDQLVAVFDALDRWYATAGFRGCAILNAAAQHHADPATSVATRHLDRRLDLLTGIAGRAGAGDPAILGRQLLMVTVGATVVANHQDRAGAAADARRAALALLRAATAEAAGDPGTAGDQAAGPRPPR